MEGWQRRWRSIVSSEHRPGTHLGVLASKLKTRLPRLPLPRLPVDLLSIGSIDPRLARLTGPGLALRLIRISRHSAIGLGTLSSLITLLRQSTTWFTFLQPMVIHALYTTNRSSPCSTSSSLASLRHHRWPPPPLHLPPSPASQAWPPHASLWPPHGAELAPLSIAQLEAEPCGRRALCDVSHRINSMQDAHHSPASLSFSTALFADSSVL